MLLLILSGTVLACGALLILSGTAKLYRAARRTNDGGAIRESLHISRHQWRRIEPAAALIETATGAAVCAAFHPLIAGVALATLGATFTALLAYARHTKASGGCACVGRSKDPDATIAWPVQARAAWLVLAGIIEALLQLPRPAPLSIDGLVVGLVALSTLTLMLAAEGTWHSTWRAPACRRWLRPSPGKTVRELMKHGVFETMTDSVGPFTEHFAYHREGCVEEFRFAAAPRPGRSDRTVTFRVSRASHDSQLAVEARIDTVVEAVEPV